jgi:hypothetical protein
MSIKHRFAAALLGCALALPSVSVFAAPAGYEFQPAAAERPVGSGVELAVRLSNKTTGKPVEGAVIFRTRLDMSPDDMAGMTSKVTNLPATEPGVYKFKADLTMAGGWALKLMVKVPGESETVEGTVIFQAK